MLQAAAGVGGGSKGEEWTFSIPSGTQLTLFSLAYGNGLFIAGTLSNTVVTSTNALTWTLRSTPITGTSFSRIVYGNGVFVGIGTGSQVYTTTNGVTWTQRTATGNFRQAAYGNGRFIIISDASTSPYYSTNNGVTWTAGVDSLGGARGLVYAGNIGEFVGINNIGQVWTTTDAVTWSYRTDVTPQTIPNYGTQLTYDNGVVLAVDTNPNIRRGLSNSLNSGWTFTQPNLVTGTFPMFLIQGLNNQFFYSNGNVSNPGNARLATSNDGTTWTWRTTPTIGQIWGLAYGASRYVAIGANSTAGNNIITSGNGITNWTTLNAPGATLDFAYNPTSGLIVAGGALGSLKTSSNGFDWTDQNSLLITNTATTLTVIPNIQTLGYGNNLYFYGANNSTYATSTNAITWTSRTGIGSPQAVTYGNGIWVVASVGAIRTSTNAITWTARTSNTSSTINSLIYENGLYVYAGGGGVLHTSTDGITWTARTSNTTSTINSLTYGNGLYMYGANGGVLATSTDAITWTLRTSGTTSQIYRVVFGNDVFVYSTLSGDLRTSTDGITWTARTSNTTLNINNLLYASKQGIFIYTVQSANAIGYSTK
jgi:hypothetical protein